jgi:pimeloyl-ACP methyl ester carboxylesterase
MPTITSADGTRLHVTSTGSGPGLVVVPGGVRHSHHYRQLTESLADSRTVHVMPRRAGGDGAIEREVEDTLAVLDATGSAELFGHSRGGLVALHVALRRELGRLVVHEPGAGLGDPPLAEVPGPGAMATFLTGLGFAPVGVVPLPAYTAFAWFLLQAPEGRDQLLPAGRRVAAPTLVITSDRGPGWLRPRLAELVPHARYVRMPQVDHHAAGHDAPAAVADLVRAFLTTDDAEAR